MEAGSSFHMRTADGAVSAHFVQSLQQLGYSATTYECPDGADVSDVLKVAESRGVDAVLLVRYFAIGEYVTVSGTETGGESAGANVGDLELGRGFIPTIELYDAATQSKLYWYYNPGNDPYKPLGSQVVDRLFVSMGTDEDAAKAAAALMLDPQIGPPKAPTSVRDSRAAESEASSQAARRALWADDHDWDFRLSALPLGYNAVLLPARYGARPVLAQGFHAGVLTLEGSHIGVSLLGVGVAFAGSLEEEAGKTLQYSSADAVSIELVDLRYTAWLLPRLGIFAGGGLTASLAQYSEPTESALAADAFEVEDTATELGLGAAFTGVRFEGFVPMEISVNYSPTTSLLGVRFTIHPLGSGRRPYDSSMATSAY